jgi:shikimate kinase
MSYTTPIILIGPMGSGKSTIARLLEERTGLSNVPIDYIRWYYYFQHGFKLSIQEQFQDFEDKANYWKQYDLIAIEKALLDFPKAIIDFGAGHSYYPEDNQLQQVREILEKFPNVFLLLPSADIDESYSILSERIKKKYPQLEDGVVEYNRKFLEHPSNRMLSKHIIYSKNKSPEDNVEEIIALLK